MVLHRTVALALLMAATLLGGCVYRPDIQQGNLLKVSDIDQVTVGMTRSQVRFLLGTPMVSDPFAPDRWDYVYRMEHGRDRSVDTAHFVVYFEGDTVVRVEMLDMPKPPGTSLPSGQQKKGNGSAGEAKEPPPLPTVAQPQPDSPRPGGN